MIVTYTIVDYTIEVDYTEFALTAKVKSRLDRGWILHGNLAVSGDRRDPLFSQVLVKYEEKKS